VEREGFSSLLYLCVVVALLVGRREKVVVLLNLCKRLVVICYFFFVPSSFLMLFILFEVRLYPILLAIICYGGQVEKVGAAYYLLVYTRVCASVMFYFLLASKGVSGSYLALTFSQRGTYLLRLAFLVKIPVYFLHF